MAERNAVKDRKCQLCGDVLRGKAYCLKVHSKACKQEQEVAAAQAIMAKLAKEMGAGSAEGD